MLIQVPVRSLYHVYPTKYPKGIRICSFKGSLKINLNVDTWCKQIQMVDIVWVLLSLFNKEKKGDDPVQCSCSLSCYLPVLSRLKWTFSLLIWPFFCFIPMKISQNSKGRIERSQFWWLLLFQAQNSTNNMQHSSLWSENERGFRWNYKINHLILICNRCCQRYASYGLPHIPNCIVQLLQLWNSNRQ